MEDIVLSWSGGKDSALSLLELSRAGDYRVVRLLTTATEKYRRSSMHGVRLELMVGQAASLGLPLDILYLSESPSNAEYEKAMGATLAGYLEGGIRRVAFGDIFLPDLREYREGKLALLGMEALFPLWKRDTRELMTSFIAEGFKAILTCVDTEKLDPSFAGRLLDHRLLADLPEGVDPCGENGEYHSFVFDGPLFRWGLEVAPGDKVLRDGRFCYCDLLPGSGSLASMG